MRTQPVGTTGIDAGPDATAVAPAPYLEDDRNHRSAGPYDAEPTALRRLLSTLGEPAGWRVRTKLIAILAVPVIAILVFAGNGAASVLTSTRDVNRIHRLNDLSRDGLALAEQLEAERTYTVGAIANADGGTAAAADSSVIAGRRNDVNRLLVPFQQHLRADQKSLSAPARAIAQSTLDKLSRLPGLRAAVLNMRSTNSVQQAYTTLIAGLNDLISEIPQGNDDTALNGSIKAAVALAQGAEVVAQEQSQVYGLLLSKQYTPEDFRAFLSLDTQKDNEFGAFQAAATSSQVDQYRAVLDNGDVGNASDYSEDVLTSRTGQPLDTTVIAPDKWAKSNSVYVDQVDKLADSVLGQAADRVDTLRSNIQRRALITGLIIVLVLGAALIAAMVVARSLVRPLLALRGAALDVAGRRLPDAVRRLRDSTDQRIDADIESVGIDTDEEIGEVARAFDEVHREAVRLASEQAVLRNNVNAMFVNLSRRSQGLVERQLRLIDDLENREQDPDQLSNLFKLDHLATRMRRNNESLLVLAGTDTARRWTHPVPINEVVLAAISEVEQYTRVKQTAAASLSIAGHAVSDVVHLIAELLENATAYSPPATEVSVMSHSLGPGAGAMIEIVDHGIGMPAKDLERVNERLASPPVIDVTVSRTMGLFAVGRLAGRHGIRAQLRESDTGGITALVRLPARVVTGEDPADGNELENEATASTRALPRGGADAGRPALTGLAPSEPVSFPMVDTGANGHGPVSNGNGHGNGARSVPVPEPELDDLADLGEITAGTYLGPGMGDDGGEYRDPRDLRESREDREARDQAEDEQRRRDAARGRSTFEPRRPQDPSTGPFEPFTAPERIRPVDDERAATGGTTNGYRSNGFGPSGYNGEPRTDDQRPAPDGPPLPRRDLASRYRDGGSVADRGYADPARPATGPAVTGPTVTGPNDLAGPGSTGPRSTGPTATGGTEYPGDGPPVDPASYDASDQAEPEPEDTDTTPIFDSVSAWFQRRTPTDRQAQRRPAAGGPPTRPAQQVRQQPPRQTGPTVTGGDRMGTGGPSFGQQPDPRRAGGGFAGRPAPEQAPPQPVAPQPAVAAAEPTWSSAADEGWRAAEAAREAANSGTTRSGLPIRTPKAHLVPGTADAPPRRPPTDPAVRSPEAVGGRLASFYQGVRQAREIGSDSDGGRDARENM